MDWKRWIVATCCVCAASFGVAFGFRSEERTKEDFDVRFPGDREARRGVELRSPSAQQRNEAEKLLSRIPGTTLRWDGMSGAPKWISAPPGKSLSIPTLDDPATVAAQFVDAFGPVLGLSPTERQGLRVTSIVPAAAGGWHVHLVQEVEGIEVFQARANVNIRADGAVRSFGSRLYGGMSLPSSPSIGPSDALRFATEDVYPQQSRSQRVVTSSEQNDRRTVFDSEGFGRAPQARLVVFPEADGARLAWEVRISEPSLRTDYRVLVDAGNGRILYRTNVTRYVTTRVLADDTPDPEAEESEPAQYQFAPVVLSSLESPAGWIADPGSSLEGNNASSHLRYWTEPGLSEPSGVYDYPYASLRGALLNAWYWANDAHDRFYRLGFNENSGNFQLDNFGNGGTGNDPVRIVAWAGGGRNNAFFSPSVDGGISTLNFLWVDCTFCGDHDGYPENGGERSTGFMRDVVYHEYVHGVSTRIVGGPNDDGCLNGSGPRGVGEGISDLFAASMFNDPAIGRHFVEGSGWFRDLRHDLTYGELCVVDDAWCSPYGIGMIWAGTLWDLRQSFLALDPDGGLEDFHSIVLQGLYNTACHPTLLDARDGILDADTGLFGAIHHETIWNVFAARGMGVAAAGSANEDFTVPAGLECTSPPAPVMTSVTPEGDNVVRVDYDATGAAGVEVWREELSNPFDEAVIVGRTNDVTTFADDSVQGGKFYRYHVVALGNGGVPCRSAASSTSDVAATGTCEAFPIFDPNVSVSDGDPSCALTLSWDPATTGCPGTATPVVYNVYRGDGPGFGPSDRLLIGRTTTTSFQDTPPDTGTTPYYLVLAEHGTLQDAADHRDRGPAQVLRWVPGLPRLGRQTVHSWDFDSGAGTWTTDNSADPDGAWTLVAPTPTSYAGVRFAPDEPAGGTGQSWVTGDVGTPPDSITEHDCDGSNLLTSPVWDASGGETLVSFDYWSNVDANGGILLVADNGTDSATVSVVSLMTSQPFATLGRYGWQRAELDLAEHVAPTSTMSVTFISSSNGTLSEFGIDNVRVDRATACSRSALEVVGVAVDDATAGWGNGNGVLEPGETARLLVDLENTGSTAAWSPSATLIGVPQGVVVHEPDDQFPDIPAGETRTSSGNGFTVSLETNAACEDTLPLTFDIVDAAGARTVSAWDLEYGASTVETVFEDDFETDKGWTRIVYSSGWWERVDPIGTFDGTEQAGPEDCADGPGTLCYVTESGPNPDPNEHDVDSIPVGVRSPLLDLSSYKRIELSFDLWFYDSSTFDYGADFGSYDIVATDSENLASWRWRTYDSTGGWVHVIHDLTPYFPPVPDVNLTFSAIDQSPDHVVEMAVDNVRFDGERRVCNPTGVSNPPNGIGNTLRLNRPDPQIELLWTSPAADASHDHAAYYEILVSEAPGSGFSDAATTTTTTARRSPQAAIEHYVVMAVNAAGRSSDWPPASCGDGARESNEVCDGADLAGQSCVTLGFETGTLTCVPGCTGFDTSLCRVCGNDAREGPELCDGADLAGQSCVNHGFQDGTLGCNPACDGFDTSQCSTCSNDVQEGAEVCDGPDLSGESCQSQGFQTGLLACNGTCDGFDTSGCSTCGNEVREAAEVCDGADLAGETCQSQGFDKGSLACSAGCDGFDTSGCENYECGNGTCEPGGGENCVSCPDDCNGVQSGNPGNRFCCGDGGGENPVDCSDPRCVSSPYSCDPE